MLPVESLVLAAGTPKRQAVEKWLPASSQAHRVERWMLLCVEDLEAQAESSERSPTYIREIQRWATPGPRGYLAMLASESIHAIDYTMVRQWQKDLVQRGLRGKTLWNVTGGLSSFLGWLVRTGVLERVPPVPWPRYDEHVSAIVRPEVQDRILDAIPKARRGAFLAMALVGLRHSEAFALDGRDYRDGRLWVRRARKGRRLDSPVRGPKNRRPRVLPVPDALAEWIEKHVSPETLLQGGPLFPNPRTGNPWSTAGFRRTWEQTCQAAGFPILKPYEKLRHATPRYARLADERLESIVGRRRDQRG